MLRPQLFRLLESRFGSGRVAIANENEEMVFHYRALGSDTKLVVEGGGEYYRVNCPYCSDTRRRLWINHRWGLRDERTGSLNLFLCICYNESCLEDYDRVRQLYDDVFSLFDSTTIDVVREGDRPDTGPVAVVMPGEVVPVNELSHTHPARLYLDGRGFDVDALVRDYTVMFCHKAYDDYSMAQGRIIIPIFRDSEVIGWQARCVGNPGSKYTPKYYSMPRMRRNQLLYNFDQARKYPFVVVVEGPTDVWNFGPESVGLLGKSISSFQLNMIVSVWPTVYILLDGDALVEAQGMRDQLNSRVRVKLVELPTHADPGSLPTPTLRNMVFC